MKSAQIAIAVHAALATFDEFTGEKDVVAEFELLSPTKQEGLVASIEMLLADDNATESTRHTVWSEKMTAEGWTFGQKLNEETKKHPRLVEFTALPRKEQAREKLLLSVSRAVSRIKVESSEAPAAAVQAAAVQVAPIGFVQIEYVGGRDEHKDNLYGTNLVWEKGQVHNVPANVAARMLAHSDTYKRIGDDAPASVVVAEDAKPPEKPTIPLPQLANMEKADLITYAKQHYGEILGDDMTVEAMRETVLSFVQGRGR